MQVWFYFSYYAAVLQLRNSERKRVCATNEEIFLFVKVYGCDIGKMQKVLIITYYWPPSGGAGVQRWLKFVKYFPECGIQPIVLTVEENLASYPLLDASLAKEVPKSVNVIRTKTKEPFGIYKKIFGKNKIPSGGFSNEGGASCKDAVLRFIRGNFFIPDARIGWNKFAFEIGRAHV